MKDPLIQQALDALEFCFKLNSLDRLDHVRKTVKALRARLAEPEPEPVGWFRRDDDGELNVDEFVTAKSKDLLLTRNPEAASTYQIAVYTAPPTTEGMVLVPIEPSEALYTAWMNAGGGMLMDAPEGETIDDLSLRLFYVKYKAMIKAAQEAM